MKTLILFLFTGSIFISPLCAISQNSLSFDGIDDRVDCGDSPLIDIVGSQITLEAWIYPTSWTDFVWQGNIINKEYMDASSGYMLRCGEGGRLNFNLGDGDWHEVTSFPGALELNIWQHVAATYDGVTQRIYVNGIEVDSEFGSFYFSSNDEHLTIGDNAEGGRHFPGRIDEVKIWNIVRFSPQIIDDMNNSYCSSELPITGLVAYYSFDQGTAGGLNDTETTLFDYSGWPNNGSLTGFALTGPSSNWVGGVSDLTMLGYEMETIEVSTCYSYTVPSGDETYTEEGTYLDTLGYEGSCDELLTIVLTFDGTLSENTISPVSCDAYTVPSGDEIYILSGTYMDTLLSASGCDSVLTINLTINASAAEIDIELCGESYTVPSGDETYLGSGTYMDTISNVHGCDSVLTINLLLLEPTASSIDAETCDSYTVPSGDNTYFETGVYTDVIPNEAGCDSVITINLIKIVVNTTVTILDPMLTANAAGFAYQWLDCNAEYGVIDGATNQLFTPESNGDYAVEITDESCADTSECYIVNTLSFTENELKPIVVFPNPTAGSFTIVIKENRQPNQIIIYSLDGKLIKRLTAVNQGDVFVDLSQQPAGMYLMEVILPNDKIEIKLIKE